VFLRPGTLDEALAALAETRATILSGGTDLFPALSFGPLRGTVLDISAISELRGTRFTDTHIEIGGRTTWSEILSTNLPRGFDGLKAAAREIGAVQIQNQATVAGNICNASPAADGIAALMALDADVTLASHSTTRTQPLKDFVLGNRKTTRRPDELLTSIRVPRRLGNAASIFLKLARKRLFEYGVEQHPVGFTQRSVRGGFVRSPFPAVQRPAGRVPANRDKGRL